MNKDKIVQSLILGGSLMFSVGIISLVNVYAGQDDSGNNSGVYRPINEGPDEQVKQGGFSVKGGDLKVELKTLSNTEISESECSMQGGLPQYSLGYTSCIFTGEMAVWGKIYGDYIGANYYVDPNWDSVLNNVKLSTNNGKMGNLEIDGGNIRLLTKQYSIVAAPALIDPNTQVLLSGCQSQNGYIVNTNGNIDGNGNPIYDIGDTCYLGGQMAVWGRIYGDTLGSDYYIDPNFSSNIYSLGIAADLKVTGTTILNGTAILNRTIDGNSNGKSVVNKEYIDNNYYDTTEMATNYYTRGEVDARVNNSQQYIWDTEFLQSPINSNEGKDSDDIDIGINFTLNQDDINQLLTDVKIRVCNGSVKRYAGFSSYDTCAFNGGTIDTIVMKVFHVIAIYGSNVHMYVNLPGFSNSPASTNGSIQGMAGEYNRLYGGGNGWKIRERDDFKLFKARMASVKEGAFSGGVDIAGENFDFGNYGGFNAVNKFKVLAQDNGKVFCSLTNIQFDTRGGGVDGKKGEVFSSGGYYILRTDFSNIDEYGYMQASARCISF